MDICRILLAGLAFAALPNIALAQDAGGETPDASRAEDDNGWTIKPRGRLLFDVANISAPAAIVDPRLGSSSEIRRARLGVSGKIPGGFGYKFEVDFVSGDAELTDAILTYKNKSLTITAGQHKNFQSLEESTSSNNSSFIERAAFTDAFGFGRRLGLSAQIKSGAILLQGGVFTDNVDDLGNDNSVSIDGRAVFMPKLGGAQLHLGAGYHHRDLGRSPQSPRYRQRPFVHTADIRFINTGRIPGATSEDNYGFEAALISGRFHAAAEASWLTVSRSAMPNPTFFGASLEAGVYLTNDTRRYKDGAFKGVKVKRPVGNTGLGALQFNIRYDRLDLSDAGVIGGKQNGYMASLIWTPVDNIRFMLNYARLDYNDAVIAAGGSRDYSVDVVGARAQFSF